MAGVPEHVVLRLSTVLQASSERQLIERLQKVVIHEVGHNLGLPHCKVDSRCVMRDAAEKIQTIDEVDAALCEACKSSL